jgi:hypothetical protein
VAVSPDIGIEIWDSEELTNASDENQNSIIDAIVQAWSGLTLNAESTAAVLTRLLVRTAVVESAWSIARFISEQVRLQAEHLTSGQLASMGAIARKLWDLHAESVDEREDAEAASLSLNSWPGLVSHFWILEISTRWRADREGWNGLEDEERLALERIVAGSPRGAAQSAIPAVTRELAFLFNADPLFTVAAVVPLFGGNTPLDWSWGSYLYNPSWNDGLLEQGFYEHVLDTVSRLEELDSKRGLDRQFLNLVLNIVSFSSGLIDRRLELVNAIVIKDDGDWASRLVRDLIGFFIFGTLENNEPLWNDWLRTWMTQRLIGIPRTPSTEELAAWADLIPYLAGHAADALALFGDLAIPITSQYVHPDLDAIDLRPIVDDYIRHLSLRVTATTIADSDYFGLTYQLRDLIEVLTEKFDSATVAPLVAAAAEKGVSL